MSSLRLIAPRTPGLAAKLSGLQRRAYLVEAARIGWREFPPLFETRAEFHRKLNRAFVLTWDLDLAGLLCFEPDERGVRVSTLVVEPRLFRHGIGTALVRTLIAENPTSVISAMTARRNRPALGLYKKLGFRRIPAPRSQPSECVILRRGVAPPR